MAITARLSATVLLLAGFSLAGLYLLGNAAGGTFGFTGMLADGRPQIRVLAVRPGGSAQRADVQAGDAIAAAGAAFGDRFPILLLANAPLIAQGDTIRVLRERGGRSRAVTLIAQRDPDSPRFEALYFCVLAVPLLTFGWLLIWRRSTSLDICLLGAMLLLFGVWIAAPDRVGPPAMRFWLYEIVASAGVISAVAVAAVFFARYPQGLGLQRSPLRRCCLYAALAASTLEIGVMAFAYLSPAWAGNTPQLVYVTIPVVALPLLAAFVCFVDAYRNGNATERMRLRWLGGAYFLGFSGPVLLPPLSLILGSNFTVVDQALLESTLFILAIGMGYGILRRRVVDVAFVMNRALVFSLVSGIIVGLFISIEWLTGLFFLHISRATSYLLQAGIAVFIGFSMRPIHNQVDRFIDRVFFAKRHAAERALHHLATEIHFIRDRAALMERVLRDVSENLEVASVAIYYRDDPHGNFLRVAATQPAPEIVDADDEAAVALAVSERPVDLHRRNSVMHGELAIPLAIRKALVGILVLGERASQEAFAPDEIESLQFLANNLAPALAAKAAPENGVVADQALLREILGELRTLNARLGEPR